MAVLVAATNPLQATAQETDDKTLSPYFLVITEDDGTDLLPLQSTRAEVKISGVIANVTVKQVYKNHGQKTLEAIYVFPGSTRAAVHAMRMTVGERVIEAQIMERQMARDTYEKAKQAGQTTSLLEQQRPNVFQMNVANILPGDIVTVQLEYTELIEPVDKIYEFVYPAVVGPRYSNTPAAGAPDSEKWVANPYLHSGEAAPYQFGLSLDLQCGLPINELTSPSSEIEVKYHSPDHASVKLTENASAGTKDFVLRYKLAGNTIETGLLLYQGRDENFFLLMMEPPARVNPQTVLPREYIFIVDVSGSMNGFPLDEVAKPLMKQIINGLRPDDYINVLLFAGGSEVLSANGSIKATNQNKQKAVAWIDSQQGGGGTEIVPALQQALAFPQHEGLSRIITVVTDGFVSVEPVVFDLIGRNLGQANLFAFGIGSSVNRHLIEGMARAGLGEPFVVLNASDGKKQAERFKRYIESPVLTDIAVKYSGLSAYDVEPPAIPDLFADRPLTVFGKYKGKPQGSITVTGRTTNGPFEKTVQIDPKLLTADNSALGLLWARHKISRLSDRNSMVENDQLIQQITDLGLQYHLMTAYTSFVAVDQVKRANGQLVTVKQPLPLPEGVSDLAVGQVPQMMALPAPAAKSVAQETTTGMFGTAAGRARSEDREKKDQLTVVVGSENDSTEGDKGGSEEQVLVTLEDIRGDLPREAVENVLRESQTTLENCLLTAGTSAEYVFKLIVGEHGQIAECRLVSTTIENASVLQCLKKALEALVFPNNTRSRSTLLIKISYSN
jgi:Ca-activated chloride channel family protein